MLLCPQGIAAGYSVLKVSEARAGKPRRHSGKAAGVWLEGSRAGHAVSRFRRSLRAADARGLFFYRVAFFFAGEAVPSEDRDKQSKIIGKYLRYLSLGTQLFVSIGLLTYAGFWLDGKAGTLPLFTLIGSALGFAAGFYSIYVDLFPSSARRRGGMAHGGRVRNARSGRAENEEQSREENGSG